MKATLVSGRELQGDFACLDKQGNLIFANTTENITTPAGAVEERLMGLVLIPIEQQKMIEVQVSADEEGSMRQQVQAYSSRA